jgi:PRTRC genetic system ThiF family protein
MKMKLSLDSSMLNRFVNVKVAGCGGTGSYLLPMLAQMNFLLRNLSGDTCGINVTAYDPSEVRSTNVSRSNYWPMDLGKSKSKVLIERLNMGYGTTWDYETTNIKNCHPNNTDFLMTCTDTIKSRLDIGSKMKDENNNIIWIDGGNAEHSINVCVGHLSTPKNTMKIPNWFDLYGSTMKDVKDDLTKSCSHLDSIQSQSFGVNQQCAMIMARVLWRMLRHGSTTLGMHYCDIKEERIDSLQIDPEVWKTFEYSNAVTKH